MTGVSVMQWRGTIGCFNILRNHSSTKIRHEPLLIFSKLEEFFFPFKFNFILFISLLQNITLLFAFSCMVITMLTLFSISFFNFYFLFFPHFIPSRSDVVFTLYLVFSFPKGISYIIKNFFRFILNINNFAFSLRVLDMLLIMAGIEKNPGPNVIKNLSFAVWNLDSLPARDYARIPLIESFQATYKFDVFGICESALTAEIANENILIEGFSPDPIRADKADDTRNGGVCLYFREDLPIKSRPDLAILPETIVAEIKIKRKKIFFLLSYRHPNIPIAEFRDYVSTLEKIYENINLEHPSATIICGDFNARSPLFWDKDTETREGEIFSNFLMTNNRGAH